MRENKAHFVSIDNIDKLDSAAETLSANILDAYDNSNELIYISSTIKRPHWETKEIREAKRGIRHKLRKARNTKCDKDWRGLRSHQAEYRKLINKTRKNKWKEFCQEMDAKSTPGRIAKIIKNDKIIRLTSVRKPDGKLTEAPEETLNVLIKHHFKDNTIISDTPVNITLQERHSSSVVEDKINDNIFSYSRANKAVEGFSPLSAAGPDGIRPIMLQRGWEYIADAFIAIAKKSFCLGYTPKTWRASTSIFLPKPGKKDYYDCKSYRTITLAQVQLKLMERLIQWHLEADEGISFNAKQFGFSRGQSTISALHRFIAKVEDTLSGGQMALGTFLDIEGAFDNISFSAIEKALNTKCHSHKVKNWIMSMITNRNTTVSLNDTIKNLTLGRGCPQGGILSPFLWNVVMDSLLGLPRNKIITDIQAFADDIALLARGHDANTLRDITQNSINTIEKWCKESGLTLSTVKTHVIMFTRKRKWKISRPIHVNGTDIKLREHTKFLGVTIDNKPTWNEHIKSKCKKAKSLLMMCKRTVGPTWGLTPATMKWVYRTMVRSTLLYAATIWVNAINTDKNLRQLKNVQRLSHIMTTGAVTLDIIDGSR